MKISGYNQEYTKEELKDRQNKGYTIPLNMWWNTMKKPRFYYQDLNNYTSEFLQEIILYQKQEIEFLETALKVVK